MDAHTYIGTDTDGSPVALSLPERLRHVAIFGATGVGKSTLLRHIVQQDMERGEGVLFIDPHGDDAELLIDILKERIETDGEIADAAMRRDRARAAMLQAKEDLRKAKGKRRWWFA